MTVDRKPAYNSTYKKLTVQWLNEVQFFNQTFVQVDSFTFGAASRCASKSPPSYNCKPIGEKKLPQHCRNALID
jgi:hypothetical protein